MKKESNPSPVNSKKPLPPPPPPQLPKRSIRDDEARIKKILNDVDFKENGSMGSDLRYLCWNIGNAQATLDGEFTAEELEAIAWWMRHKSPTKIAQILKSIKFQDEDLKKMVDRIVSGTKLPPYMPGFNFNGSKSKSQETKKWI